jgi:ribosomal protein S18 acetylase RimI-like enzyme
MPTLDIRSITAEQTHPLRNLVLRPGRPVSDCRWPGDDAPGSFHAGVFVEGMLVAIATVIPQAMPDIEPGPPSEAGRNAADGFRSFRLRGMATHPQHRGQGLGTALLAYCINRTHQSGGDLLWCNARTPAAEFYRRKGFEGVGEEFETPDIGPHVRMRLDLSRQPGDKAET